MIVITPGEFLDWATDQKGRGINLVVLDGLLGAGKTYLVRQLGSNGIDLDDFLPTEADGTENWASLVVAGGCLEAVRSAIAQRNFVVAAGAAASVALATLILEFSPNSRRAYIKRVTRINGHTFWDDGVGLLEHAERSPPYFKSIYEFHGSHKPWASADVIVERYDN